MKKAISFIRVMVLIDLGLLAMAFILGGEVDELLSAWTLRLILDKALGLVFIYAIICLYKRWSKIDPWLKAYDRMCREVMSAPNPMYMRNDTEG